MHQENIKLLNVNAPTAQNYKMREAKSIRLKSEIKGALIHRWWACKLRNHYGKQHRASSKTKNGSATRPGELPSGCPPGKHANPDPQTYTRRDVRSGTARGGQDRETSECPLKDACTKERHTRTTAGCSSLKTRYFHSRRTFQAQPTEEKTLHFLLESIRREQLNQVWTGYICLPELRYRLAIVVMTPPLAKKWTPKQPEISEDGFTGHRRMSNFKRDARTCSPWRQADPGFPTAQGASRSPCPVLLCQALLQSALGSPGFGTACFLPLSFLEPQFLASLFLTYYFSFGVDQSLHVLRTPM